MANPGSNFASAVRSADDPLTTRLIVAQEIRFSEIISAMSVALDITQGNPAGHCMRTALIGMRLADELRLSSADASALFYALLLKDLGCSSNAAKISYLFRGDDLAVKRSIRMMDWTRPAQCFRNSWKQCAPGGSVVEKLLRMAAMVRSGPEGARKISEIRCERGAEIARMLQLPEATAAAIASLDEHWNGQGSPRGLKAEMIPLLGRICCLAQTVEVFFTAYGLRAAIDVAEGRRGQWFDPQLVDALLAFHYDNTFWQSLATAELQSELARWEPEDEVLLADEACLDRVAEAFAKVVDAKSPWTYEHSTRVAEIAVGVAKEFGCAPQVQRDLRRAALLHDIGKLGVSNLILDKPEKPTPQEFEAIRKHPDYSLQILTRVEAFAQLADIASAHHERLDGQGYHRRLDGTELPWAARVLAVADMCEAMSARRPYREAIPWTTIQQTLAKEADRGVDRQCVEALDRWHDDAQMESRVEAQLCAVERLLAEL